MFQSTMCANICPSASLRERIYPRAVNYVQSDRVLGYMRPRKEKDTSIWGPSSVY
jgi:hypothetical protein